MKKYFATVIFVGLVSLRAWSASDYVKDQLLLTPQYGVVERGLCGYFPMNSDVRHSTYYEFYIGADGDPELTLFLPADSPVPDFSREMLAGPDWQHPDCERIRQYLRTWGRPTILRICRSTGIPTRSSTLHTSRRFLQPIEGGKTELRGSFNGPSQMSGYCNGYVCEREKTNRQDYGAVVAMSALVPKLRFQGASGPVTWDEVEKNARPFCSDLLYPAVSDPAPPMPQLAHPFASLRGVSPLHSLGDAHWSFNVRVVGARGTEPRCFTFETAPPAFPRRSSKESCTFPESQNMTPEPSESEVSPIKNGMAESPERAVEHSFGLPRSEGKGGATTGDEGETRAVGGVFFGSRIRSIRKLDRYLCSCKGPWNVLTSPVFGENPKGEMLSLGISFVKLCFAVGLMVGGTYLGSDGKLWIDKGIVNRIGVPQTTIAGTMGMFCTSMRGTSSLLMAWDTPSFLVEGETSPKALTYIVSTLSCVRKMILAVEKRLNGHLPPRFSEQLENSLEAFNSLMTNGVDAINEATGVLLGSRRSKDVEDYDYLTGRAAEFGEFLFRFWVLEGAVRALRCKGGGEGVDSCRLGRHLAVEVCDALDSAKLFLHDLVAGIIQRLRSQEAEELTDSLWGSFLKFMEVSIGVAAEFTTFGAPGSWRRDLRYLRGGNSLLAGEVIRELQRATSRFSNIVAALYSTIRRASRGRTSAKELADTLDEEVNGVLNAIKLEHVQEVLAHLCSQDENIEQD